MSDSEREVRFEQFLTRFLHRGYVYRSHTKFTAELYRPARFPRFIFRETSLFLDIDPEGRIYVRKREY